MTILEEKVNTYLTTLLGRTPTASEIASNISNPLILAVIHNTTNVVSSVITISSSDSIQDAIDSIAANNGGTVLMLAGTYILTDDINIPSGVTLKGVSTDNVTIVCGDYSITMAGTDIYTTGTITSITNGVVVVGSGTSWLSNVTTNVSNLYIGQQLMNISTVIDDTHIILSEGYDGPTIGVGSSYRITTPVKNVTISSMTLVNSTGSAIKINDSRYLNFDNLTLSSNNIGLEANNVTELKLDNIIAVQNTSHGISITDGGRFNFNGVNSVSNGGSGIVFNGIRSAGFATGVANSNTDDGFNITNCIDLSLNQFDASSNGDNGIQCVSNNSGLTFTDAGIRSNTLDGLKFTDTTDACNLIGGNYEYNGGYGINIVTSWCNNNVLVGIIASSNSSGSLNDIGTGTLKSALVNIL